MPPDSPPTTGRSCSGSARKTTAGCPAGWWTGCSRDRSAPARGASLGLVLAKPDHRQFLGERPGPVLQPADLRAQLDVDRQQDEARDEEEQVGRHLDAR